MKVLFITRKYPPMKGGMESYSYNLIENYEGDCQVVKLCKSQKNLIWFFPYTLIYVLLNAKKYDIIELGDMLLSLDGWLAKRVNKNIKVVATCHGLDMTFSKKIYQWYLKKFSYGFDLYVPNSTNTDRIAREKNYEPRKVIFPATIAKGRFQDVKADREAFDRKYKLNGQKVLITTGRLVPRKGVEWFVDNVLGSLADKNIIYLVAGDGEKRADIEKAIEKNKLSDKVRLLGRISDYDMDELYVNADIFVMPNIVVPNNVEGYGMVAIEAAAAECVVVASALQGIKDAVIPDTTGILVEPENADEFKQVLTDVIDNFDSYRELTDKARKYANTYCTGKAIADQYRECFEELMDGNKA